jgi:hypothetical protein
MPARVEIDLSGLLFVGELGCAAMEVTGAMSGSLEAPSSIGRRYAPLSHLCW